MEEEKACHREMNVTELLIHAMEQIDKDNVDRVAVVMLDKDGYTISLHSNARSEPELLGMLQMASESWKGEE